MHGLFWVSSIVPSPHAARLIKKPTVAATSSSHPKLAIKPPSVAIVCGAVLWQIGPWSCDWREKTGWFPIMSLTPLRSDGIDAFHKRQKLLMPSCLPRTHWTGHRLLLEKNMIYFIPLILFFYQKMLWRESLIFFIVGHVTITGF